MTDDPTAPERRLREAYKQAVLARVDLEAGTQAREFARRSAATAESALVCLEGPDVLDGLDVLEEVDHV